ncbi:MAG: amino acid permease, partial [Halobacteria archaeon]|nr:amino acid permease [Halobacteria archaeon]
MALCSGYSYSKLNQVGDGRGGSVSFVENIVGNSTLAGMFGWTLLFGYIGSMAMYAFAFAEFALGFGGVPEAFSGVPLRPVVSIVAVAAFVGLNLVGARATGSAENLLVAVKMAVLAAFGVFGGRLRGRRHARTDEQSAGRNRTWRRRDVRLGQSRVGERAVRTARATGQPIHARVSRARRGSRPVRRPRRVRGRYGRRPRGGLG